MKEESQTPFIEGYKTLRADQKVTQHGGLVSFVKGSLIVEELSCMAITETSSFHIRMGKERLLHITNMYVLPSNSKGQDQDVIRLSMRSLQLSDGQRKYSRCDIVR